MRSRRSGSRVCLRVGIITPRSARLIGDNFNQFTGRLRQREEQPRAMSFDAVGVAGQSCIGDTTTIKTESEIPIEEFNNLRDVPDAQRTSKT